MHPESQHLEYKREITDTLEREVVGFLNSREGGRILIGVDDSGTILGLADPDGDQLKIKDRLKTRIIHNDYSYEGVPKFELFTDRLEITSTGSIPQGLSEAEFFEGYSIPRNKELMRIFRDLDMVEYLGSGMPRILRAYPKECFHFTENFTRMVFPFSQTGTPEKTPEKILQLLHKDNQLTIAVLAEKIGVTTRTIERSLKNLQKQGTLIRQGPDKGGHWQALR